MAFNITALQPYACPSLECIVNTNDSRKQQRPNKPTTVRYFVTASQSYTTSRLFVKHAIANNIQLPAISPPLAKSKTERNQIPRSTLLINTGPSLTPEMTKNKKSTNSSHAGPAMSKPPIRKTSASPSFISFPSAGHPLSTHLVHVTHTHTHTHTHTDQ